MRRATGSIRATRTTTSAKKSYLVDSAFRKVSRFYPRRNQYETPFGARRHRLGGFVARGGNVRGEAYVPEVQTVTRPADNTGGFGAERQDRPVRRKRCRQPEEHGQI